MFISATRLKDEVCIHAVICLFCFVFATSGSRAFSYQLKKGETAIGMLPFSLISRLTFNKRGCSLPHVHLCFRLRLARFPLKNEIVMGALRFSFPPYVYRTKHICTYHFLVTFAMFVCVPCFSSLVFQTIRFHLPLERILRLVQVT